MYSATDKKIWSGRSDAEDGDLGLRWHHVVKCVDLGKTSLPQLNEKQKGFAIIGFCCDEGVRRNKGRTGAFEGPEKIREALANYAWHLPSSDVILIDCGNVECHDSRMEDAQQELADVLSKHIIKNEYQPIILGGGHEVSFGGYCGIFNSKRYHKRTIGIINFDAHFDLRDYSFQSSSGTPFRQIADLHADLASEFRYLCLGIQIQSNTKALFQIAEHFKVDYLTAAEMAYEDISIITHKINEFIESADDIYLSIDLDVFDISDAPGVSATTVPGVDKRLVFKLLNIILKKGKTVALDIAELNPSYDRDLRTAKLAASIIFKIIEGINT